jgi:DNA-binding response OmpR family regulator
MDKLQILIIEDETISAMQLEDAVTDAVPAEITTCASLAGAKAVLTRDFDFAFLDIEVTDGHTFEVARELERKSIPFAFVSAQQKEAVPVELRGAPFIPKPFRRTEIAAILHRVFSNDKGT